MRLHLAGAHQCSCSAGSSTCRQMLNACPNSSPDMMQSAGGWSDRIAGVILGTAVGEALGLPREGLSRRRAARLFGDPPLRHRFLFGRGMVSDDTEHTCMTSQALLHAADDVDAFARSLAWRLRF